MILKNILPVIIISLVMAFLYAASKKKAKEDELGNIILQLPKLYSIFGILIILGGIGLLIFASFFAHEKDSVTAFIASLIALIAGMFVFAKGYISQIKVTDSGIIETTIFGKQKEIKWHEIIKLSFGTISLELKIKSADKTIKAHLHLVGFQELVYKLENKTGKSRYEMGILF